MSKPDGGPAFPEPERYMGDGTPLTEGHGYRSLGMTLRDWFAGQALKGFLAAQGPTGVMALEDPAKAATWAYEQADAMLSERRKVDDA